VALSEKNGSMDDTNFRLDSTRISDLLSRRKELALAVDQLTMQQNTSSSGFFIDQ
jgi:hypothetical protein